MKEIKKTDNPREGWEDGTPPPHRDFKERCVVKLAQSARYFFFLLSASSRKATSTPGAQNLFFRASARHARADLFFKKGCEDKDLARACRRRPKRPSRLTEWRLASS